MMIRRSAILSVLALLIVAEGVFQRGPSTRAFALGTPTVSYELTFDATWSDETHPNEFPPGPHFSGLIGGTHNDGVSFWEEGGEASQGVEDMAERGSKAQLQAEVEAAIGLGNAGQVISGPGISPSPGSTSVTFTATQAFPLATVVTMIAPSPDWFVGVDSVQLFQNGQWVSELVIPLYPYDAGTDSGASFTSSNADITPHIPIAEITAAPFSTGDPVVQLGTFTFRRVSGGDPSVPTVSEWGCGVMILSLLTVGTAVLRRRGARPGACQAQP